MARNEELKIVFGAMSFGKPNTLGSRVHDIATAAEIIDLFQQHGHNEIDTARIYGGGSSEEMIADLAWKNRGLIVDTKLYPNAGGPAAFEDGYTHRPEDIRRGLTNSLKALQTEKVDIFYLHAPDRNTPFEDTLREVNKLHQESRFSRLGLSNFMAWEVAQICEICIKNDWVRPTVYQGVYHVLQRSIEAELIFCLRKYEISLYGFQPLAGGLLTGRYKRDQTEFEEGSRFDPKILSGTIARGRYWNDAYFDALETIHSVAAKHALTDAEIALRWLKYHSKLSQDLGDAIIVGASRVSHLDSNLQDLEKGELPGEVVQAVEEAWSLVKGAVPNYWH
ncbi:Putative Aldo/keto reductase [Penicillium brasilianum]|uniref:Putative Aldo/keto reductase n=1 Tax=Penicillium brasilianum TaxID=104259 RepID=A0A0F7TKW4_PENBI|nr:Putative Aldo/keto reductase [Penicillium brasilianum]